MIMQRHYLVNHMDHVTWLLASASEHNNSTAHAGFLVTEIKHKLFHTDEPLSQITRQY